MPDLQAHPAFPGSAIFDMAEPGVVACLSALELGAFVRLVAAAWREHPPCSLRDEDSLLAMVAGCTCEEWSRVKPRLLLALGVTQTPPDAAGRPGARLHLQTARRVYEALAENAAASSANKRQAGLAGAKARWQPMAGAKQLPPSAKHVPSSAIAAPSLRSPFSSLSAPTLQRPTPSADLSARIGRSSAGAQDVIAVMGEGARAILAERVKGWRRRKSLDMLQEALARWSADGLTTCPVSKAAELASCEHAEPARVEALIQDADGLIAAARAKGTRCNPVGLVIHGLGESSKAPGRVAPIPLFVADRWSKLQAETLRLLEAQAALTAHLARARSALPATDQAQELRHGG